MGVEATEHGQLSSQVTAAKETPLLVLGTDVLLVGNREPGSCDCFVDGGQLRKVPSPSGAIRGNEPLHRLQPATERRGVFVVGVVPGAPVPPGCPRIAGQGRRVSSLVTSRLGAKLR